MMITVRSLLLVLAGLLSLPAAAQSCYVSADASTGEPSPVATEKCYEYQGMDKADAIDWSCRNSEDASHAQREKRDSCPTGYFGKCVAPLTPETLSNEQATGTQGDSEIMPSTVPEEARILTYYYKATEQAQVKIDCEKGGGKWTQS